MLTPLLLALAVVTPTDRDFYLAETDRPYAELVTCSSAVLDDMGKMKAVETDYGTLIGLGNGPVASLEVHDGSKRTLVMHATGMWRMMLGKTWKKVAKECFPELRDVDKTEPKG